MSPIYLTCAGRKIIVFPDRLIGKGGYSLIFEGRDIDSGEKLAVKAIEPQHNKNQILRERSRREGDELRFEHPNLVKMLGYCQHNGNMFIVSKFIEGTTLQEKLDSHEPMSEHYILHDIISPLLNALEYLHNRNIIHRDVKASNIIVEPNGNLRLIDLGISQLKFLTSITDPASYPRTEHYAPPEIIKGEPNLTPAADLYSAGILLYQLLTNRLPFTHHNRYNLYQQALNKPLPHDNRIRPEMWVILDKLTKKERGHRYQTTAELRTALFAPPTPPNFFERVWNRIFLSARVTN